MEVKVFQPHVRAYREFLFSAFKKAFGRCLVVYGGIDESSSDVSFKTKKIEPTKILGFNLQFNLRSIVFKKGVNIVGLDLHWPSPIFWGIIARLKGIPLIFWGHGFGNSWLARFLKLFLIKFADALVLYSDSGKREMLAWGVPPQKVFVAPNTVQIDNFTDCTDHLKNTFLFVGRLQERKRLDFLLHAFSKLPVQDKEIRLKIIGDGPLKASLKRLAEVLKIDNRVEFIPGTSNEKVLKDYFSQSIAYVSPGACGLGILHAFAYGVPVITCKEQEHGPEIDWLRDGYNGFLVPVSEVLFAEKMRFLDNNQKVSIELGKNAYNTYLDAKPEKMILVFKSVVDLVCSKN